MPFSEGSLLLPGESVPDFELIRQMLVDDIRPETISNGCGHWISSNSGWVPAVRRYPTAETKASDAGTASYFIRRVLRLRLESKICL